MRLAFHLVSVPSHLKGPSVFLHWYGEKEREVAGLDLLVPSQFKGHSLIMDKTLKTKTLAHPHHLSNFFFGLEPLEQLSHGPKGYRTHSQGVQHSFLQNSLTRYSAIYHEYHLSKFLHISFSAWTCGGRGNLWNVDVGCDDHQNVQPVCSIKEFLRKMS